MTSFFRRLPRSYTFWGILALFVLSRVFIWIYRPVHFSEITYSYMPYAHLWASGVKPYLEQWYEYPPATIPLFYLPHIIDRETWGTPWHMDYGNAYRGLILLIDVGVFALVWKTLQKTQPKSPQRTLSLIYFIAVTAKAHHFLYDSIDWVFAASLLVAGAAPIAFGPRKGVFLSWLGYWWGVATKLVNGPLGAVYLALEPKRWKVSFFWMIVTALLIGGLPLALYRSSLQVIFVYHSQRGLQIDSMGAVVARVADRFTHTETVKELYKNYEISGPISDPILAVVEKAFPLSLAVFILFAWYQIAHTPEKKKDLLRLHLTLGYVIVFMVFSKVLSTPFLLWHIPLLAVYPFRSVTAQRVWLLSSFLFIVSCMTPLPFIEWRWIHLPTWIHAFKFVLLLSWMGWWGRRSWQLAHKRTEW